MFINRLSARHYLLWMSIGGVIWAFFLQFVCDSVVQSKTMTYEQARYGAIGLNVAYGALFTFLTPPRLRDMGFPRWFASFSPILLVAVILAPLLLFYSGDEWDNDFGPAPEKPGLWILLAGFLLLVIAIQWGFRAMISYMQMHQIVGT